MDDKFQAALKYLSTPAGSFWKWVDDGKVVAWSHGATVSFREELGGVLRRLSPRGLPPLDSVLLLIAATRAYWMEDSNNLRKKLSVPELFTQLDYVQHLPRDLTQSVEAKGDLAEIVFESVPPVLTGDAARMVCEILEQGLVRDHNIIPNLPRLRGGRVQSSKSLLGDVRWMERGLSGISEQSLRLRLKTGLDEPVLPAEIIIPAEPAAVRALLQVLALDDELSGLSRIARNLSAVLQLPRAISDSDELPLGGVSDISNRGTLDRLLLSELAHDDLMLATRVALNEALYLRRETPPSPPPQRHHVLLDSGLRMWGVPRIYATACLLSLAARGAEGTTLLAFRAAGSEIVPFDPSTQSGIVGHLEVLEPEVHPGRALNEFFQACTDDNQPGDAIVITSDEALSDPDFQRNLADANPSQCYLIGVNRDGGFQLWSRGRRGTRLLTSLTLDLEELLAPPVGPRRQLIEPNIDPDLPAIFHASPFPLRLPHHQLRNANKEVVWSVRLPADRQRLLAVSANPREPALIASDSIPSAPEYGVMILTRDRVLSFFDQPQRGGLQIATDVPFGSVLWTGSSPDDHLCYALICRTADPALYLLVINVIRNKLVTTVRMASEHLAPKSEVLGATSHLGMLLVIYRTRVEVFRMEDGSLLDQSDIDPRFRWTGSRFFFVDKAPEYQEWFAASFDASKLFMEPIRLRGPELTGRLLRLFDRSGVDGPFGVHLRGSIANLSDHTEWPWTSVPRPNPRIVDIDHSGHRILIEHDGDRFKRQVLDLNLQSVKEVSGQFASLAHWDLSRMNVGGSLMHRFTRAYVSTDRKLVLTSKSQTNWQLEIQRNHLVMSKVPTGQSRSAMASFEQTRHPHRGCSMLVATWQDGSRAFVDSRGLLHLQSADKSIPEATLVLNEFDMAAWTSHGHTAGAAYFIGIATQTPEAFVADVLNPFVDRLR
ncbi:MAG: hypothetical protein JSS49_07170 [Planctomycetes bacterium]|nr:hypothetical protein [Planctomycetota bacterium]